MNQLLGVGGTTFEQMTGRVLAEHYRDRNNRALANQVKKKNCEKENPKLSSGFAHVQPFLPFAQPADNLSLLFLQLHWERTALTICAILLMAVKTGLCDSASSVFFSLPFF